MVKARFCSLYSSWNDGENHLIFNIIPSKTDPLLGMHVGNAIVASSVFDSWTYRSGFDISFALFNPLINISNNLVTNYDRYVELLNKKYIFISLIVYGRVEILTCFMGNFTFYVFVEFRNSVL